MTEVMPASLQPATAAGSGRLLPANRWRLYACGAVVAAFVLMGMLTLYVWSHVRMTQLEYKAAAELNRKEQLLDEQRKLKMEFATLKSRKRIETIARDSLNMTFPLPDQVIVVK